MMLIATFRSRHGPSRIALDIFHGGLAVAPDEVLTVHTQMPHSEFAMRHSAEPSPQPSGGITVVYGHVDSGGFA